MISRIFCHQSKCSAARPSPCFDIPHIVACVCSPLCQNEVANSKVSQFVKVTNGHTFEDESYKLCFCSCLESGLERISLSVLPTIRKLLWFTVARLLAESGLANRNFSGQRRCSWIYIAFAEETKLCGLVRVATIRTSVHRCRDVLGRGSNNPKRCLKKCFFKLKEIGRENGNNRIKSKLLQTVA